MVRLLGRGAMGQVYLAHDSLLDRPVAVKFVHAADVEARARVFEEARAIARLQHPNVVAIYRVAEVAQHPYLVSEYVRGRTLDQLERPLAPRKLLDLALDLTRGLAAAHRCGVLHRDVKPANAILTDDGRAKLLDFGLARVMDGGLEDEPAPEAQPAPPVLPAPPVPPAPPAPALRSRAPSNGHLAAIDQTAPGRRPSKPVPAQSAEDSSLARGSPSASSAGFGPIGPDNPWPSAPGTPLYMAPEVWRGEAATRRSDLYSLGILLYELAYGAAPHRGVPMSELGEVIQTRDVPRLAQVASGIDPRVAAVIDRLVERDPMARFGSADSLLAALEECAAPFLRDELPDGNPYRGLAAFDASHGALFFGRRKEIRELVDRVRNEAFVVVGGDSGNGKSSLCRAGALPWLAAHDGWSCVDVLPGRFPVRSLAASLAAWSGLDEADLASLLRTAPDEVARAIRRHAAAAGAPRRLLLFVDQLEELLTLADPEDARAVAAALAALAVRTPSIRVLACCRSDFLSRAATLPVLGDEMARGLYFLPPLTGERIREVIVRPAAAKGVAFESEALIDTLVEQTEDAPGGLPLLQFTLAELWDARDVKARKIRAASLTALGGVGGALTRHADRLLSGLRTDERDAARRILLRLVTADGTRARRPEAELLPGGVRRDADRAALEVLVRGRVVVANDAQDGAYEIAHEALLTSWSTLQGWLAQGAADHAARARVGEAATAWERSGRSSDLLWRRRQLAEVKKLDREGMAPRELAFLDASRLAGQWRWVIGASSAIAIVIAAVVIGLAIRAKAKRDFEAVVSSQLRQAEAALESARETAAKRDELRTYAFGLFNAGDWKRGEEVWTKVDELAAKEEREHRVASGYLEGAVLLDPSRPGLRERFVRLTFERLLRAEQDRHRDLADELHGRLATHDPGYLARLETRARVEVAVSPPGTRIWSEAPGEPPKLLGEAPLAALSLPPGSVTLSFEAPGRVPARLPVLLARGETLRLEIALPDERAKPPGMVYVPPGRFLFGSADGTAPRRGFLNAAPLHEVTTAGYYIGKHEVTYGEWIEFLESLPPEERLRRRPNADSSKGTLSLDELAPKRWRFTMRPSTRMYTAETGQPLRYEGRSKHAVQDWTKFPVAAVSFEDALAYAAWLDRTGRVPGARLCTEHEWERAARGADARTFPTGEVLAPDAANIDATYGRVPTAFGPDEVGSHPASRSPVGADDMAGNVWEWTVSVQDPGAPIARGGCWYVGDLTARSMNREHGERSERHPWMGLRLCSTPR